MTESEELAVLRLVANRLDDASVAYMVSGSVAMSYYAEPRMTRDIDIVIELGATGAERMAQLFSDQFHCDVDVIRDAIRRRSMFNLIHTQMIVKVDFIVRQESSYRLTEFDRRRRVQLAGFQIWIVSPEDLVLSKLVWAKPSHSELQLADVRNLVEAISAMDWTYIEAWAARLDVMDLVDEVRA